MKRLAIIGGTGVSDFDGLELSAEHSPETAYGPPSRPIQEGRLGSSGSVFFLQRHGSPRAIPPHLINYRANLAALKSLGIDPLLLSAAAGRA